MLPTPVSPCLMTALTMRCPPHCLAQANGVKVRDFLADAVVAQFLVSDSVASLTFKAERKGPNTLVGY